MKLEHIAPYLPYKLKVLYTHTNTIGIISNIYTIGEGYDDEDTKISIDHYEGEHLWMFKPILRPLSGLTKEITHNGETFVPIEKLEIDSSQVQYRESTGYLIIVPDVCNEFIYACDVYDNIYKKLFEWHFDVFGLIESGKAIDINTLSKH